VSVGQILVAEFPGPTGITQSELAVLTGLPRKYVNELCQGRRVVTANTALVLARAFGNSGTSSSISSGALTWGGPEHAQAPNSDSTRQANRQEHKRDSCSVSIGYWKDDKQSFHLDESAITRFS
jgi:transcriptional regulator with XRE-family HTH domain